MEDQVFWNLIANFVLIELHKIKEWKPETLDRNSKLVLAPYNYGMQHQSVTLDPNIKLVPSADRTAVPEFHGDGPHSSCW